MSIHLFAADSSLELPYRAFGETLEWLGRKMVLVTSKELKESKSYSFYFRALLSTPGAFLRLLASLDKLYLQVDRPQVNASVSDNNLRELKVITLNAACLPSWITQNFNSLRSTEVRAQEIADYLSLHHDEYDVICLQEVFSESACTIFRQTLKERYSWSVHHAGEPYIGFNSGLCLFSKFPIETANFQKFSGLVGEDAFTNKGFLSADIQVSNQIVRVYTTHTQAGGYPNFMKKNWLWGPVSNRRKCHFEAFQKHIQKANANTVIVTGDFNLNLLSNDDKRQNGDGFFKLFQKFRPQNLRGTSLSDTYLQTHKLTKHHLQKDNEHLPTKGRVIDGVFVTCTSQAFPQEVEIVDSFTNSSDHLAVCSTITLAKLM